MKAEDLIIKALETPCITYKEYIDLRKDLPEELKNIVDCAYEVDKEIERIKTALRLIEKAPVYYIGRVIELYSKLSSYMLLTFEKYSSEEDIEKMRQEINHIMKYLYTIVTKGVREPSYTLLQVIVAIKHFIYLFVYVPVKQLKDKMNSILIREYCSSIKSRMGVFIPPSELLKEK